MMLTTCGCTPVASMVTSASALMLRAPVLDTTTWRPPGVTSILNGLNATGMSSALSYVMLVPSIDSTPTLFIRGMQTTVGSDDHCGYVLLHRHLAHRLDHAALNGEHRNALADAVSNQG